MTMRHYGKMLLIVFTLCSGLLLAQDPPTPAPPKRAPQPPKNLKVLKPEQVRATMGNFRASLGVECTHCHVKGDFASDDNPKKGVALKMLAMTKEINGHFEEHEPGKEHVTCFTCHRGATEPATMAPMPAGGPGGPPPGAPKPEEKK